MRILLALTLLPTLAFGQHETGSVSGHIYCADTQQPARVARVVLVPLPLPGASVAKPDPAQPEPNSTETHFDGSFSIPRVPPGDYYLSVTYSGYLSPEYQFNADELLHPTEEARKRILQTIPTVIVVANKSSTVSATIHRGAAISGTIRYDDGSPVPEIQVLPLIRDSGGSWKELPKSRSDNRLFGGDNGDTDDLGRFRIRELPPGEYSLAIERYYDQDQKPLTIYYGDSFLVKEAKSINLGDGEESSGNDITIHLSKLHTISGSLLNVSGQPINTGEIGLFTIPDNIEIAHAIVDSDDLSFRFDLVPEGHYTLRVTGANDVLHQTIPAAKPGDSPIYKETTLQTYADYTAPLEVLSDISTLSLTIPSKSK